jgi:hypothetical protein
MEEELQLCDAQAPGGLLAAVNPAQADAVLSALMVAGVPQAAVGGRFTAGASRIKVSRTATA